MRKKRMLMFITACVSVTLFFAVGTLRSEEGNISLEVLEAKAQDDIDELDPEDDDPYHTHSVIPPFWGGVYLVE